MVHGDLGLVDLPTVPPQSHLAPSLAFDEKTRGDGKLDPLGLK